jgi:branched-subunit amino acid aminotransferase/4-amino-4-deoxychorismate lyase
MCPQEFDRPPFLTTANEFPNPLRYIYGVQYWHYNGQLIEAEDDKSPGLPTSNRGFLYADGLFETIRCLDGRPISLDLHVKRLKQGLKAYGIQAPVRWNKAAIQQEIEALLDANNLTQGARVRLTATRRSSGYYTPNENQLDVIMEAKPLNHRLFRLNERGLNVDVFNEMRVTPGKLSGFKNIGATLYVQSGLYARKHGLDEALIKNDKSQIIESTSSNLFLVGNGVLYTPGLDSGATAGVMRAVVINAAIEAGIKVYECNLTNQNLMAADEIFLTNAISGIRWVVGYRSKRYYNSIAETLLSYVNAAAQAEAIVE